MGQFDKNLEATANADDFEQMVVEEFKSAWEQAIERIAPPEISSFLGKGGEGDFSDLARRLEALDSEYRNRFISGNTPRPTGNSTAEQKPPLERTVLGSGSPDTPPPELSWDENPAPEFAGTVDWVPQPEEARDPENSPYAPTIIGDTAKPESDPTDAGNPANGKSPSAQRVAGYEVLGVLGRGGMGVVYRARQVGLNRLVALKMILHGKHVGAEILNRFQAEAKAVAQLQHPNITQIYDIGTHEGLPYFSLELVDGPSLAAELAGQPMKPERAAELLETLARAMHYAHARGIIHRDLKPANVLLTSKGVPKVTDFGLVKRVEAEDSEQTRTGVIMGTPSYMAPEQAWGSKEVGPLADIYSLGATLYCLLTGRPPFVGPTAAETVLLLRAEEPVAPSKLQPNLPKDLETICLKCLQKEPEKRYATAEELAEDLRRFRAGEPILARPVGRAERLWRWGKRNPALAWSGGAALVLALCLMIGGPLAAILINKERNTAVEAQGRATENAGLARDQRDLAVDALDTLIERLPKDLKNIPGTDAIKRALLLTAMDGLNRIGDVGGPISKDFKMAKAFGKMGEVLLEIGETKAAREQFLKSHAILLELAESEAETAQDVHHLRLGRSYRNLGKAAERLEGAQAAYDLYAESLREREAALPLASNPPFVKQEIAGSLGDLGRVALDLGRPHEGRDFIQRSIDYRAEWLANASGNEEAVREQAGAQRLLGHACLNLGQPAQAAKQFEMAISELKKVAKEDDPDITDRANIGISYTDLGMALLFSGNPSEALKNYQESLDRLEPLFRANNRNAILLRKLGNAYYGAGAACQEMNHPDAATHLERSVVARRQLFEKISKDRASREEYMLVLARYGKIAEAAAHADAIAKEVPNESNALFLVACTYALCAAEKERSLASEKDPPTPSAEEFRAKAMTALRDAVKAGYQATAMLKSDPDLAGVRNDADFQKLIHELEQHEKIADRQTE